MVESNTQPDFERYAYHEENDGTDDEPECGDGQPKDPFLARCR